MLIRDMYWRELTLGFIVVIVVTLGAFEYVIIKMKRTHTSYAAYGAAHVLEN
jgi:hypothetical protein